MTESKLRTDIAAYVRRLARSGVPIKAIKYHGGPFGEAGTPDWHITLRGRSYWIEAKVGDNDLTPIQAERLRQWAAAGAVTAVVRSVDDLARILDQPTDRR